MHLKKQLYLIMSLLFTNLFCTSQGYVEFTENKGQWDNKVLYNGITSYGQIALMDDGYTVLQYQANDFDRLQKQAHDKGKNTIKENIKSHVWQVQFANTNPNTYVTAEKALSGISNYYIGNNPTKWASNCKTYTEVTYNNLYQGINLHYYSNNGTLKYDIIVQPNTDVSKIAINYKGINNLTTDRDGNLVIPTSVGKFKEKTPYAYQVINGKRETVNCSYKVKNNQLTYKLGAYNPKEILVIDPTLIFSTHSGSTANNWGYTATYGPDETFYGGGDVRGQGFPQTPGAYDNTYDGSNAGTTDIGIIKLSANGSTKIYSTYIGGNNNDQPHSLITDAAGNLYIAGRSDSDNFPATTRLGVNGKYDIIIVKLNANGTALLGSCKIGGSDDDGVNISNNRTRDLLQYNYGDDGRSEVNLDAAGNVLVASCTRSTNFYTTQNAIKTTLGGTQDAVLLKLNNNLTSAVFSTYFGGTAEDAAYVVDVNAADGNIYFAGGSYSSTIQGTSATSIQSTNAGNADGFVTIIRPDGLAVIQSSFIGTGNHDQIYGIKFDKFNIPYIMGISLGNFTVRNAAYSNAGSHQFIAKLSKDLSSYIYSTKFGTNSSLTNISPVAFLVDKCENVYVSGWGGELGTYTSAGTLGLPITPGAFKTTTDNKDFYYFVLERNATSQLFGSFFGGNQGNDGTGFEHVDGGTSRFDPKGSIYQAACASCGIPNNNPSGQYFTTAGSYSQSNGAANGGGCNLGMTKIRFALSGVVSDIAVSDTSGCVPLAVNFRDNFENAITYDIDYGDGTPPLLGSTTANVPHTYNTAGYFRARLIAIDPNSCNLRDTSYKNIRVRNDRATVDFTGLKQPPCLNLSYLFTNNSIAPVGKPFTANSFTWNFGDNSPTVNAGLTPQPKTYAGAGTYVVRLYLNDTNYCNAPDSAVKTFRLSPTVKANFSTPQGCAPYTLTFANTSLAGATWEWSFGDGGTSTLQNPTYTYTTPGTYIVRLIASDPNTCNFTDTLRLPITIYPTPVANFSFAPNPALENTPTQFNNLSTNATTYRWRFGDGDSTTAINPLYQYNASGTFNVCLRASNTFGCFDDTCNNVVAIIRPALDVASGFSPNGDGRNDKVWVRGFGIKTIVWRIFNRWGQLVYETTQRNAPWDGTYKGVLQPMDAYAYTLDVELSDGQKVKKSGNITLIR